MMQVSLKRADYLARQALLQVAALDIEPLHSWSIYATTEIRQKEVEETAKKLSDEIDLGMRLIRAGYKIREQLSWMNNKTGISDKLNERAARMEEEKFLSSVLTKFAQRRGAEPNISAAANKAVAARGKQDNYYAGENVVSVIAFDSNRIENIRKQIIAIRDAKMTINEELSAMNVTNTIKLDDDTVATLKAVNLIK